MLLGRDPELKRIGGLMARAREGSGGALLFVGEPGIGKTSLLAEAAAEAAGMRVIEAAGIESEANLPYALVGEAVTPLLDGIDELPEPQAGAIRAALALAPSPEAPASRFATCAAFLGLLTRAADREPVLMVVDDAHWLDASSAECFAYAARRLESARVALLVAARPGAGGPLLAAGALEHHALSGLDPGDARAVLGTSAPEAPSNVVEALVEVAAGNPLALRELPAQLTDDQRLGLESIDPAPIAGAALLDAFEAQLAALGAEERSAVLVASAALDRKLAPMIAACRELGIGIEAIERAEAAGVLRMGDDRFSVSHPLVRAVAYERSAPAERRRAHRALAQHCGPDESAWHLAAAAVGPDADVADLLEGTAARATARGAHRAAADALQRAAELSQEPAVRCRRLYGAALAAAIGGAYDRCAVLLGELTDADDPLLRARARHGLAVVMMTGGIGIAPDAPEALSEEAELIAPVRPATAAAMHADAALLAGTAGNFRLGAAAARRASAVLPGDASPLFRSQVVAMAGTTAALTGEAREARGLLDEAGELLARVDSLSPAFQSVVLGLHARVCTGQERALGIELARLIEIALEADTFGLLPFLLGVAADVAYRVGDWEAAAAASRSADLAAEHGQGGILPFCLIVGARLRAARGETPRARAELERGIALAEEIGAMTVVNWGRAALGFLELGAGRTDEAIAALEPVRAFAEASGLEDPVYVPWAPDLVESYVRAGRLADAERASSALDRKAARAGVPLSAALAARCRGLVANRDFDRHFGHALDRHEAADAPFEAARTKLAYGSRLHRARRRRESREQLRAALGTFERLGAQPWIDRCTAELRAAGALRRDPIADPDELSPQEIRVAIAVAAGATNKEVAAKLYLSPKTIEFHLGRAYRKLGIHSRTELATLVAEGGLGSHSGEPAGTD